MSSINETTVYTESDVQENGIFDFNCGGITSYVQLDQCTSAGTGCDICLVQSTQYYAVGVCHYGGYI